LLLSVSSVQLLDGRFQVLALKALCFQLRLQIGDMIAICVAFVHEARLVCGVLGFEDLQTLGHGLVLRPQPVSFVNNQLELCVHPIRHVAAALLAAGGVVNLVDAAKFDEL
jgi:hypothetical protein